MPAAVTPSQEKPHCRKATQQHEVSEGLSPHPLPLRPPTPQPPHRAPSPPIHDGGSARVSSSTPPWMRGGSVPAGPPAPRGCLQEQPCATETPQHHFYWQTAQNRWRNHSSVANMVCREAISSSTPGSAAAPAY